MLKSSTPTRRPAAVALIAARPIKATLSSLVGLCVLRLATRLVLRRMRRPDGLVLRRRRLQPGCMD